MIKLAFKAHYFLIPLAKVLNSFVTFGESLVFSYGSYVIDQSNLTLYANPHLIFLFVTPYKIPAVYLFYCLIAFCFFATSIILDYYHLYNVYNRGQYVKEAS